jgi:hypothetical protein
MREDTHVYEKRKQNFWLGRRGCFEDIESSDEINFYAHAVLAVASLSKYCNRAEHRATVLPVGQSRSSVLFFTFILLVRR